MSEGINMNDQVRAFLVAIRQRNDEQRQGFPIAPPEGAEARLARQALDYMARQRLVLPVEDGYRITEDGRAWLLRN